MKIRTGSQLRLAISHLGAFSLVLLAAATTSAKADGVPERCVKCHTEAVIVQKAAKIPPADRKNKLEEFLANHFAPDAAERTAIAAALAEKAGKR